MVLVESEAEPYHFVQREDKKNLGVSQGVIHQFVKCCNRYLRMLDVCHLLFYCPIASHSVSMMLLVTARTIFNAFLNLRRKRRNVWRFHSIFQFPVFFALRPFLSDFPRFSYQRPKHDYDLCWERKMKSRVSKYWILSNTNCDRATMRFDMMGVRWLSDTRYRTRTVLTSQ